MTSLDTKQLVSSEVLACMYLCVAAIVLLCRVCDVHPDTQMIRTYSALLFSGAIVRVLYQAIPNSVYDTDYTPTETVHHDRFSASWARNGAHLLLFLVSNVLYFSVFALIVLFWAKALLSTSTARAQQRPTQFFRALVVVYVLGQVAIIVLYCAVDNRAVVLLHSFLVMLLNLSLAVGFVTTWMKLSLALRPRLALDSFAYTANAALVVQPSDVGPAGVPSPASLATVKLRKLTVIAVTCTVCCLIKAAAQVYQVMCVLPGKYTFPRNSWWLILFVYYTLSEVLTPLAVLVVFRRGAEAKPRMSFISMSQSEYHGDRLESFGDSMFDPYDTDAGATDDLPYVTPTRSGRGTV